ncbi:DNA repair protein rhp57 [Coemansia spiralis]|uniref:DNA repair protein rhp57 n=2 Tax=Coemansia TaxID=4863 RepID=A0A9W8GCS6_9FUNG|nr:P-loop containing nucleoside triphosphate hydrolase protein [Coemansia spiralis]KAJ1995925.1 DNA repair protein rhp57 [Coemansia umbellata]KAJ2625772.1 DNA repair protein rhp57 [Coemansia sp. RSA 1358]KAJ2680895.1 DNA repair protein rhp57 [Coemansia spiralis]
MANSNDSDSALLSKCLTKVGCEEPYQCMLMPYSEFLRLSGLDEEQGQRIWTLISSLTYPWKEKYKVATEVQNTEKWIYTGDQQIDKCLGGGIRLGSIVEVVGEGATGKTQLCIQLAIAAQLPESFGGVDGDVVYISTEGAFPVHRLESMILPFVRRVCGEQYAQAVSIDGFMRRIQLAEFEDMETMFHALDYKVPAILSTGRVRLVVVDSIAAHLRYDMDSREDGRSGSSSFYKERTSHLVSMGARFKRWADEYQCAFICVNQVKDIIDPNKGNHGPATLTRSHRQLSSHATDDSGQGTGMSLLDMDGEFAVLTRSKKAPALGSLWANIIDARVMMYQRRGLALSDFRCPAVGEQQQSEDGHSSFASQQQPPSHLLRTRRWIENDFSPWAPRAQCEVVLGDSGFQSIHLFNTST